MRVLQLTLSRYFLIFPMRVKNVAYLLLLLHLLENLSTYHVVAAFQNLK